MPEPVGSRPPAGSECPPTLQEAGGRPCGRGSGTHRRAGKPWLPSETAVADALLNHRAGPYPRRMGSFHRSLPPHGRGISRFGTGDRRAADEPALAGQFAGPGAGLKRNRRRLPPGFPAWNQPADRRELRARQAGMDGDGGRGPGGGRTGGAAAGHVRGRKRIAFETYVQASYSDAILREANKRLSRHDQRLLELLRNDFQENLLTRDWNSS